MTFHDLMVTYVCLALVWCVVGTFGEWCIYVSAVLGFFARVTGAEDWIFAINAVLFVFIFKSFICFLFTPREYYVYIVNDSDRQ